MLLKLKLQILVGMIRRLLIDLLTGYVRLGLRFYFRRLDVYGLDQIPLKGPVLFAANHQNSFLDALILAAVQPRRMHYLVRADVFKRPWAARILRTLNMMPVFRFRDGWQSIGKNAESFEKVADALKHQEAVLIFPEGNHSLLRRLRPLSRGFTKPLALALQHNPDINISVVPVGLNFSDHQRFRSEASVYFGKPIPVNEFFTEGTLDANRLRERLSGEMKQLIVHVEDLSGYEETVKKLENSGVDFTDPVIVNRMIAEGMSYAVSSSPRVNRGKTDLFFRWIHFPVLFVWSKLRMKIKDPVFVASLKFVFGIFAVPVYYVLIWIAFFVFLGSIFGWYFVLFAILTTLII